MNRVLVAMSGGVDSSVAAKLLMDKGYEVEGAILRLTEDADNSILKAESVAKKMGIPLHVIEGRKHFKNTVIKNFVETYVKGATPNPCVFCNRECKIKLICEFALENGFDFFATGHYARIKKSTESNCVNGGIESNGDCGTKEKEKPDVRFEILKGRDLSKDQSYMLYRLSQQQLSKMILPLGEFTKDKIRELAAGYGFENANDKDSQDICFIPDGDYVEFIKAYLAENNSDLMIEQPGNFVSLDGKILGQHNGTVNYTIGQRKGLGISFSQPMYVAEKNVEANEVVLCKGEELFENEVVAGEVNFVKYASFAEGVQSQGKDISEGMDVSVKVRYSQKENKGKAFFEDGKIIVRFEEPVRAPAKGQSMVLYEADSVVAGGFIC